MTKPTKIPDLPTHVFGIVYDQQARQYYNTRTDIYLGWEDEEAHNLLSSLLIPYPVPVTYKQPGAFIRNK
jgi:hypothetical protein